MNDRQRRRNEEPDPKPLFNQKAERYVIGMALIDPMVYYQNSTTLKPEHFTVPRLARIWAAMQRLAEVGRRIRREMIPGFIQRDNGEDTPLTVALDVLANDAPPVSEADLWVKIVADHAGQRAVIEALQKAMNEVRSMDIGQGVEDMRDVAMKHLSRAEGAPEDDFMMTYQQWGMKVFHESAAALNEEDRQAFGLSPGLAKVEEVIGRLLPGKVYVLAGMSGSGKSALARQMMEAASEDGHKRGMGVGFMSSLEMTGREYATRSLAEYLNVPFSDIEAGANMNQARVEQMGRAVDKHLARFPIIIDAKPRQSMEDIRQRIKKASAINGRISIIGIDHLLLIKGGPRDSLFDRVAEGSAEAKNIAKEFDCPLILLCQVNEKKVLESVTKKPNSSHIFGGEQIQQNTDVTMFIHRQEMMLAKFEPSMDSKAKKEGELTPWQKWRSRMDEMRGKAEVYNNKRRGGAGGVSRELIFRGETMVFSDPN